MSVDYFAFDGTDSRDFGIMLFEGDTYGAPRREYDDYAIPGRSGALYVDGKRYPNKNHTYNAIIYENFETNIDALRNFLLSKLGYFRLQDTFHPDEFYQAVYKDDFVVTMDRERDMGKFALEFERKPQRFLKSGEQAIEFTTSGVINNPTLFPSQPLIRVYGEGELVIGSTTITVSDCDEYTDIDCEMMDCFQRTLSCNNKVSFSDNDFPTLKAGNTGIVLRTGITKVVVTPRWFKL